MFLSGSRIGVGIAAPRLFVIFFVYAKIMLVRHRCIQKRVFKSNSKWFVSTTRG